MVSDRVAVPGAPEIPGLVFRRGRGAADYAGSTEAFNRSLAADGIDFALTVDEVAHWYEHASGWDPATDEVIIEHEGRIAGFAVVRHVPDSDGTEVYGLQCGLVPELRRKGIGTALLALNMRRARERATAEVPGASVLLHAGTPETAPGAIALYEEAGFTVARYFFDMVQPDISRLPDLPMPDGLEVRPVLPDHHRAIFAADSEAFRDHWGGIDESEAAFGRYFSGPAFRPELWRVAWDGAEVAGVVMVRPLDAYNAVHGARRVEINGVSVRRPWRGRGLARALVADALRGAREAGFTSATLGVDAENPTGALGVYEAVGFAVSQRHRAYRRPLN